MNLVSAFMQGMTSKTPHKTSHKTLHERLRRGRQAEKRVQAWLEAKGFRTLAINWRYRSHPEARPVEIDLWMEDAERSYWMIEVKTRRWDAGQSGELLGEQQRLRQLSALARLRATHRPRRVRWALVWERPRNEAVGWDYEFLENPG